MPLLDTISNFKNLSPPSKTNPKIRKCTVSKFISLVYRINKNTLEIELITFLNNRMNNTL